MKMSEDIQSEVVIETWLEAEEELKALYPEYDWRVVWHIMREIPSGEIDVHSTLVEFRLQDHDVMVGYIKSFLGYQLRMMGKNLVDGEETVVQTVGRIVIEEFKYNLRKGK